MFALHAVQGEPHVSVGSALPVNRIRCAMTLPQGHVFRNALVGMRASSAVTTENVQRIVNVERTLVVLLNVVLLLMGYAIHSQSVHTVAIVCQTSVVMPKEVSAIQKEIADVMAVLQDKCVVMTGCVSQIAPVVAHAVRP